MGGGEIGVQLAQRGLLRVRFVQAGSHRANV
jgi:hypothetical protein